MSLSAKLEYAYDGPVLGEVQGPQAVTAPVVVGDLDSDAKGTGARRNGGKAPLHLVTARALVSASPDPFWYRALELLADFQEGRDDAIQELLQHLWSNPVIIEACALAFDYGRSKYAEWNWMKGMPWSVPIACALRHVVLADPDKNDEESGVSHSGHFACNIVMLNHYLSNYRDGDDRPAAMYFSP